MQGNLIPYWDTTDLGKAALQLANPGFTAFLRTNVNGTISALNAADFRTAIGAQPLDSDLTDIASLTTTAYGRGLLTLANSSGLTIQSGTWTPAYSLSISGSVTPSTAAGFWWRIGRLVYATGLLISSGVSSPSGSVRITLPFPVTSNKNFSLAIGQLSDWGGSVSNIDGYISTSSLIILVKQAPAAVTTTVNSGDLATGSGNIIRFSVLYEVD
jgi:hypothetical protein